jgi:Helix-turn-helix domain
MPRPERSIDPSEGPVQQFAADLRRLREEAGNPTYRNLADLTFFSKSTLSAAASGNRMPSWEVTAAYVAACGGDVEQWRSSYEITRNKLGLAEKAGSMQPASWPLKPVPCKCQPATRCAAGPAVPVRFDGPFEPIADNADPKRTGCASDPDVATLDSVEINTAAGNFLGIAELRYSPRFHAAWGRFTPSERMDYMKDASITITARRPATHTTGTPYTITYDGQAAFGNILISRQGCVEIIITITAPSGGGSATTRCRAK